METSKTGRVYTKDPVTGNESTETKKVMPDTTLPYEDPAIINPQELATFPKPAPIVDAADVEEENRTHTLHEKRSPLREGRNIVRTDTNSNTTDGFM
ncbi:hypothetical protein ACLI09_07095 [Flavobacterium sp. RHBU_24]|uniref:hypothetical protein n=1 Tax=Flavobacterium sp. RHBU_24 TaxID=3391185 RepID=UPI003984C5E7